jgi:DNA-binding MarR family transcriptional regulator
LICRKADTKAIRYRWFLQSDSQALIRVIGKDMIAEMARTCVLTHTRLISRVITDIYDEQLRSLEISSAQFALLVAIYQLQPATRADIGRHQHLDRSTLTRHLKLILSEGWAQEIQGLADGRARPIVLTKVGRDRRTGKLTRLTHFETCNFLGEARSDRGPLLGFDFDLHQK